MVGGSIYGVSHKLNSSSLHRHHCSNMNACILGYFLCQHTSFGNRVLQAPHPNRHLHDSYTCILQSHTNTLCVWHKCAPKRKFFVQNPLSKTGTPFAINSLHTRHCNTYLSPIWPRRFDVTSIQVQYYNITSTILQVHRNCIHSYCIHSYCNPPAKQLLKI